MNKKWCIINDMTSKRALEELTAFNSKEEALKEAEIEWKHLKDNDKKDKDRFTVGLCNVEEYKTGCWQYAEDETGNIDATVYEVAKEYI